jgi:hypothetical protein
MDGARMASMTVWQARRAKREDTDSVRQIGPRILCGRMVGGEYACPETVAWVAGPDSIAIPNGLTDGADAQGIATPGAYRWSAAARKGAREGKPLSRDVRTGREVQSAIAQARKEQGRTAPGWSGPMYQSGGMLRVVPVASVRTLLCPKDHVNSVDATLLQV